MVRGIAALVYCVTAGCAHAPRVVDVCDKRAVFERETFPLVVRGTVQHLRPEALHVEFQAGDHTADGACIALHYPEQFVGFSIWLYYNDDNALESRGIAVGRSLEFTFDSPEAARLPYVETVRELRVVNRAEAG